MLPLLLLCGCGGEKGVGHEEYCEGEDGVEYSGEGAGERACEHSYAG